MATRKPGDPRYGPPSYQVYPPETVRLVRTPPPQIEPLEAVNPKTRKILVTGTVTRSGSRCDFVGNYKRWFEDRIVAYCDHWGYEYMPFFDYPITSGSRSHPVWMKHWMLLQLFPKVDEGTVIAYMDSDIAIIRGDIDIACPEGKDIAYPPNHAYAAEGAWNNGVYSMRVNEFTKNFVQKCWNNTRHDGSSVPDLDVWNDGIREIHRSGRYAERVEDLPFYLNIMRANVGKEACADPRYGNVRREDIRFRHFANEDDVRNNAKAMESWLSEPLRFD